MSQHLLYIDTSYSVRKLRFFSPQHPQPMSKTQASHRDPGALKNNKFLFILSPRLTSTLGLGQAVGKHQPDAHLVGNNGAPPPPYFSGPRDTVQKGLGSKW